MTCSISAENGLETIRHKCVEICLIALYKHTAENIVRV